MFAYSQSITNDVHKFLFASFWLALPQNEADAPGSNPVTVAVADPVNDRMNPFAYLSALARSERKRFYWTCVVPC